MARPNIVGTVLRRVDLNFNGTSKSGAYSDKDFRITLTVDAGGEYHVYTEHGPAGSLQNGKEIALSSSSDIGLAEQAVWNQIARKQGQADAYKLVSDQTFATQSQPQKAPQPAPRKPPQDRVSIETLSASSRQLLNNLF